MNNLNLKNLKKVYIFFTLLAIISFIMGCILNIKIENKPDFNPNLIDIIKNNMYVFFFVIIISMLTVGVYAIVYTTTEFFYLGVLVSQLYKEKGIVYSLSFIFPHGILEIPEMILAPSFGVFLLLNIVCYFRRKSIIDLYFIRKIIIVGVVMILLSGLIEVFITPNILKYILKF